MINDNGELYEFNEFVHNSIIVSELLEAKLGKLNEPIVQAQAFE